MCATVEPAEATLSAQVIFLADCHADTTQAYDTPKRGCDGLPKSEKRNRNSANVLGFSFKVFNPPFY